MTPNLPIATNHTRPPLHLGRQNRRIVMTSRLPAVFTSAADEPVDDDDEDYDAVDGGNVVHVYFEGENEALVFCGVVEW